MTSMTYGVMPSRADFDAAFEQECPNGYKIQLNQLDSRAVDGFDLGDGMLTADQLWFACHQINDAEVGEWDDCQMAEVAKDLVSSILFTLGFEWI